MSTRRSWNTWISAGLTALPVYAVLLAVGSWSPQPDPERDPEGWARFLASPSYLVSHLATGVIGPVLIILGTFALTATLAQRAPRLAPTALVLATTGQVLLMVPGVISTFATPAVAHAYLAGHREVMSVTFSDVMTGITMIAMLLAVTGNVMLGVVIARTAAFPRWAGIVWAAGAVIFYLLGAALGMATTGASLPTQPVGAAMLAVSGAAMVWTSTRRQPSQPSPDRLPSARLTSPQP